MAKRLLILLLLCCLATGCDVLFPSRGGGKGTQGTTPTIKGPLLAKVNDWEIGLENFREKLDAVKRLYPKTDTKSPEVKKRILEELVNIEILSQEAKRRGWDKEKDVLEAVEELKRSLLVEKLREKIAKEITVTEIEIENFYNNNKVFFREKEERKIREIVVSTEKQAKDILIKLLQGEDFATMARNYSISESKDKGGDLGYLEIDPDKKFQKFWEESFTKDKGEVSAYFKGPEGDYYIVKIEEIRGGKIRPLSEARDEIRDYLRLERIGAKIDSIIDSFKEKNTVIIKQKLLD